MPYAENFTIQNKSGYTMTLDTTNSQNIDGAWPATIGPFSTVQFPQNGSAVDLNPTGVYTLSTNPTCSANLHFYCAGVDPGVHIDMVLQFSNGSIPVGSSISEDNSKTPQQKNVTTTGVGKVEIKTTNDGASQGSATFVIGNGAAS